MMINDDGNEDGNIKAMENPTVLEIMVILLLQQKMNMIWVL